MERLTVFMGHPELFAPFVVALALVPGLGPALALLRRAKPDWPEVLCLAFALTVALVSAVATFAHLLGLGLVLVEVAWFLAIPVSLALVVVEARRGTLRQVAAGWLGLAVGVAGAAVAAWERPWFRGDADTFYHLAATRSLLATGRPLVTDPFLGTGTSALDPTSGAWHTVQALLSRTLGADIASLYLAITALGAAMVMLAFWVLARRVSGSGLAAAVATVGCAVLVYHGDLRALAYPKHLSMALALTGVALVVHLVDRPRAPLAAAAVLTGIATATTHLGAAQLLLLAVSAIALTVGVAALMWRSRDPDWGRVRLIALAFVLGLVVVGTLPVLLPRTLALGGSSVLGETSFAQAARETVWLGDLRVIRPGGMHLGFAPWLLSLALAALMVPQAFRDRRPGTLAGFGLLALGPLLLNDPLVTPLLLRYSSYMVARVALLVRFLPPLGVAWGLAQAAPLLRAALGRPPAEDAPAAARLAALAAAPVVALLVLAAIGSQARPALATTFLGETHGEIDRETDVYAIRRTHAFDIRREWGEGALDEVRAAVGDRYPVVAAEELTAFYLAGLAPVAIVQPPVSHAPVYLERRDGPARRADMARYFHPRTNRAQRRAIVERYDIAFVAVWPERAWTNVRIDLMNDPGLRRIVARERFELYEVVR